MWLINPIVNNITNNRLTAHASFIKPKPLPSIQLTYFPFSIAML